MIALFIGLVRKGATAFIITALVIGNFTKYFRKFSKYLPIVSGISGTLMIAIGIIVLTNKMGIIIPASFFIDKDGNIVNKRVGAMTIDQMKAYITSLK